MLSKILAGLRQPNPALSSAEAGRAVQAARAELAETERMLAEARVAYEASKLDEKPAATAKARDGIVAAEILVERGRAVLQLAEQRLAEAQEREAQAARVALRRKAEAKAAAAEKAFAAYPGVSQQLIDLFRVVAEGELAVEASNADLPANTAPLPSPEQRVRGLPAVPRTLLDPTIRSDDWYHVGGPFDGERVPEAHIPLIETKGRRGTLTGHHPRLGMITHQVARRRLRHNHFREHVPALIATPLASEIFLPGLLPGEPPYWQPEGDAAAVISSCEYLANVERGGVQDPRLPSENYSVELLDAPEADEERAA